MGKIRIILLSPSLIYKPTNSRTYCSYVNFSHGLTGSKRFPLNEFNNVNSAVAGLHNICLYGDATKINFQNYIYFNYKEAVLLYTIISLYALIVRNN